MTPAIKALVTKRLMLPWDTIRSARVARSNGWRLDKDDWWWRYKRPGGVDSDFSDSSVGFTMPGRVYMRKASYANAYDKRRLAISLTAWVQSFVDKLPEDQKPIVVTETAPQPTRMWFLAQEFRL